jgi:hypothetical protein
MTVHNAERIYDGRPIARRTFPDTSFPLVVQSLHDCSSHHYVLLTIIRFGGYLRDGRIRSIKEIVETVWKNSS